IEFGCAKARRTRFMPRSIYDKCAVQKEISTRRNYLSGVYHVNVRSVGVHDVLLIAFGGVAGRLKNQPRTIWRPVGFGVLSAVGELFEVREVLPKRHERHQDQHWQ